MLRSSVIALIFALALGLASTLAAQETGGSFGGGDFGSSGGGSSSGGGGDSYGGGSDGYSGGSYGGSDYGGSSGYQDYSNSSPRIGIPFFGSSLSSLCVFLVVLAVVFAVKRSIGNQMRTRLRSSDLGPTWDLMDVSGIELGIDWRSRKFVQAELERLAKSGDTSNPEGLARLLRETSLVLRRAESSWLYAAALNAHPASPEKAEATFREAAVNARSRFRTELVRNADGATSTVEAAERRARADEGEGVVVVTILVAARRELLDMQDVTNAEELKRALAGFVALGPHALVAMEVIWSPAQENDRMSTAEVEVIYPELRRIREDTIAGRVFCTYCGGPYAAELLRCPHCGAENAPPKT